MGGGPPLKPAEAGCSTGSPEALARPYLKAMLIAAGELGYRGVGVADVIERTEPTAVEFDRYFTDTEECFVAAYEAGGDYLCATLLDAGAAERGWAAGLRGALVRLLELVTGQPAIAKALLIEVHAAGGRTMTKRKEVIERLSRALDGARRETESRHSSSPLTGTFIVGAIEFAMSGYLQEAEPRPEQLWRQLPELMHLAVLPYLGEDAAWEAFDSAQAMLDAGPWKERPADDRLRAADDPGIGKDTNSH